MNASIDWSAPFPACLSAWMAAHRLSRRTAAMWLGVPVMSLDGWRYGKDGRECPYPEPLKARMREYADPPAGQPKLVVDVVIAAIEAAGHPLSTVELLDAMRARGLNPGGKDPAATLSSRLSSGRGKAVAVMNVIWRGGRAWWLTEKDLPASAISD